MSGNETGHILVLSTCPDQETAKRIASALVEAELAACVNILPGVESIYRWQGAIESAAEWVLLIKTQRGIYPEVERGIERLHPYEVPEIIALPLVEGLRRYLAWIDEMTNNSASKP